MAFWGYLEELHLELKFQTTESVIRVTPKEKYYSWRYLLQIQDNPAAEAGYRTAHRGMSLSQWWQLLCPCKNE